MKHKYSFRPNAIRQPCTLGGVEVAGAAWCNAPLSKSGKSFRASQSDQIDAYAGWLTTELHTPTERGKGNLGEQETGTRLYMHQPKHKTLKAEVADWGGVSHATGFQGFSWFCLCDSYRWRSHLSYCLIQVELSRSC
jgi:hypothetical protein